MYPDSGKHEKEKWGNRCDGGMGKWEMGQIVWVRCQNVEIWDFGCADPLVQTKNVVIVYQIEGIVQQTEGKFSLALDLKWGLG